MLRARRLAEVVGARLERQAEEGDPAIPELAAGQRGQSLDELGALIVVDPVDGGQERGLDPDPRRVADGLGDLVREAGATVADAGLEEAAADPRVVGHRADDLVDSTAVRVAQPRELVGERDLRRQEEVGTELRQGGIDAAQDDDRGIDPVVDAPDGPNAMPIGVADDPGDDPVRPEEVGDGLALAGELRVEHDRDARPAGLVADLVHDRAELTDEVGRDRRADDQDRVIGQQGDDLGQAAQDRAGLPVALGIRRRDGHHDHVRSLERLGRATRELQRAGCGVGVYEFVETRLVERHLPIDQAGQTLRVRFEANDLMIPTGETGSGHQTDIPEPHDRDPHCALPRGLTLDPNSSPCPPIHPSFPWTRPYRSQVPE